VVVAVLVAEAVEAMEVGSYATPAPSIEELHAA